MNTYPVYCTNCKAINHISHPSIQTTAKLYNFKFTCRGCRQVIKVFRRSFLADPVAPPTLLGKIRDRIFGPYYHPLTLLKK